MITGFPSPAQGYEDNTINLNELLILHPAATVFMRIETGRYSSIGIYEGDLVIIDRSLEIRRDNQIVIYESEGSFRLGRTDMLKNEVQICGAVTFVIHKMRNSGLKS